MSLALTSAWICVGELMTSEGNQEGRKWLQAIMQLGHGSHSVVSESTSSVSDQKAESPMRPGLSPPLLNPGISSLGLGVL